MNIGKYTINITKFASHPWIKVELNYKENNKGYAYIHRGWLWFDVSYKESISWEQLDWQEGLFAEEKVED